MSYVLIKLQYDNVIRDLCSVTNVRYVMCYVQCDICALPGAAGSKVERGDENVARFSDLSKLGVVVFHGDLSLFVRGDIFVVCVFTRIDAIYDNVYSNYKLQ